MEMGCKKQTRISRIITNPAQQFVIIRESRVGLLGSMSIRVHL
jgi:hypothetical protein